MMGCWCMASKKCQKKKKNQIKRCIFADNVGYYDTLR